MRFRTKHKEGAEVSTESLNDIMFFLLLFFLILSTVANPNVIKLTLPNSKTGQQVETKTISLDITKDHQYFINQLPISFAELETAISIEYKKQNATSIVIRIDKELAVQDLVDVLQIGDKLKVKMVLAAKAPNEK